jgi:hypothetical protein
VQYGLSLTGGLLRHPKSVQYGLSLTGGLLRHPKSLQVNLRRPIASFSAASEVVFFRTDSNGTTTPN